MTCDFLFPKLIARMILISHPVWIVLTVHAQSQEDDFERHVRPLLVEHCGECHIENQSGGFSLASRDSLLAGGDSGVAVRPGDPQHSPLLDAVRRTNNKAMPPDETLSEQQIRIIERWIAAGAPWSKAFETPKSFNPAEHWAFQPLMDVQPPIVNDPNWCKTSIDPFVLRGLQRAELTYADEVSRKVWLRRVTYGLTGLPPSLEEIDSFVADDEPNAYERVLERLLSSPRYGQHQARMWLDLARYSDTKGYVYAREERFWLHAWNYRDWVVRALNNDMPYNRFLWLQLAADQDPDCETGDLAAMGFLTIGRRFLGVQHDIIDDRIDVVCRGTMAMTVGCARCHDHKFDPIPTSDYYSLYGIFDSSQEQITPLLSNLEDLPDQVQEKLEMVQSSLQKRRSEQEKRVRDQFAEYLWAQTELHKYPADGFDQIFAKTDLLPAFVRRLQAYLEEAETKKDPVFVAWRAYRALDSQQFENQARVCTQSLQSGRFGTVHASVLEVFQDAPKTLRDVADRYGELFQKFEKQLSENTASPEDDVEPNQAIIDGNENEELWRVLFDPQGPCRVPNLSIVHSETFFDSGTCTELWKQQGELERAIINAGAAAPFVIALADKPRSSNARIFRRGNPLDQGAEVPRRFLTALSSADAKPFAEGSGRSELARRIIDPGNPLTARVLVNRIWAQHFGQGLVTTASDFGSRAKPPSHPELLDYLTQSFVDGGWSLKTLHRELLLSSTFRQDSRGPSDPSRFGQAMRADPENRLLWRMNPHRLTLEELRDSMLDASGRLDDSLGGPPVKLFQSPYPTRRTLYGLIDRQFLPASFRVFDFASPDLHIPARAETTIPQQALFLMNHPLVLEQVHHLADEVQVQTDAGGQVDELFRRILRREPTPEERVDGIHFLNEDASSPPLEPSPNVDDWQYGYGRLNESTERTENFTPLPHFTGDAWQGGPSFPDGALGWVQLSARGGHPGNDRQHACVRRWVAPRAMQIRVESLLKHEAAPGDGIRAFVVSNRVGILRSEKVHQRNSSLSIESLDVAAGETIDFVVDIDEQLNNDQYLWAVTIENLRGGEPPASWDSEKDFTPKTTEKLSPLEQLVQVLLCTNEFMFVD